MSPHKPRPSVIVLNQEERQRIRQDNADTVDDILSRIDELNLELSPQKLGYPTFDTSKQLSHRKDSEWSALGISDMQKKAYLKHTDIANHLNSIRSKLAGIDDPKKSVEQALRHLQTFSLADFTAIANHFEDPYLKQELHDAGMRLVRQVTQQLQELNREAAIPTR